MQAQNTINNNPSQDEASEYSWKSLARIFKLFFYFATIGVIILSFASSMGWVSALDAVIGSVAGGLTLFTAAGYSIFKNYGVYNSDGKQQGNIQIIKEINQITNDIADVKAASGKKFMITNAIMNSAAILLGIANTGLNIPAKLDTDHKNVWYLGIPAAALGGIAAVLILIGHEISAYNLRKIQDTSSKKLDKLRKDEVQSRHSDEVHKLESQLHDMQAKNETFQNEIANLQLRLTHHQEHLSKSRLLHGETSEYLQSQVNHWLQKQSKFQSEPIQVKLQIKEDQDIKINKKLRNAGLFKDKLSIQMKEIEQMTTPSVQTIEIVELEPDSQNNLLMQ